MSILSLHSKVDEVQSLLSEIQNRLHRLPTDFQGSISIELDHLTSQLRSYLQNGEPSANDELLHPDVNSGSCQSQLAQENEPWIWLALKHAHATAWKWDLVQNKMQWSSGIHELLQVDPDKELSYPLTFIEMIHPDDQSSKIQEVEHAIKSGGTFYVEYRVIRGDGKLIWLSSSGLVKHDSTGRPILAFGLNQDITDRKQIEEAFRQSEQRERAKVTELQALMDAVPAMIWISRDPECKEMVGNRYGYEYLNMWEGANISKTAPANDLEQQPYRNFKNGQEIPFNELPMQVAAQTGIGTSNYEFDLVFKNGFTRNVFGNVVPLLDQNGQPAGAVAAFVDITERKRIEDELRRSEHRFRVALASVPMVVFTMDNELRYTWVQNPRHKFTEKQMLGKRDDEINIPENVAELIEFKRAVIETGQSAQEEIKIKINNAWFHYIIALDPILDSFGRVTGLIGAAVDITTLRQLEAIQRKNEIHLATQRHLLQTRENERVKIAREIHDGPLQTMVAMVLNIDCFFEEISNPELKARVASLWESLKNAIKELRQVISELRPPALTEIGLVNSIRELVDDMNEKSPGIDLEVDLNEDVCNLPEEINLTVYRIFQEALQNVIRHSQATKVTIRLQPFNDQVLLSIKDNGIGFSFTNDFTDLVADKHYGLTGMSERTEAVGGTLQIISEPCKGTEIRLFVPSAQND